MLCNRLEHAFPIITQQNHWFLPESPGLEHVPHKADFGQGSHAPAYRDETVRIFSEHVQSLKEIPRQSLELSHALVMVGIEIWFSGAHALSFLDISI